jgi:hypothetical protein
MLNTFQLQQQHYSQHPLSSQQSQNSNHQFQQQDKMNGAGSITGDGSISNTIQGNDQVCDLLASVFVDSIRYKIFLL